MSDVAFGLFDWIDRGGRPIDALYRERLALVEAADEAGFHAYHLAEHHGTPLGMAPSPSVFLAAVAARTRRIRFGPLVYLLPLYDPLRLAEEVCMLDQLSGGRFELGVGRGISPYELGCFGVDANETKAIFDEQLAILLEALTHERLSYEGKRRRYRDVPMEVRPYQKPYPPLWYPTFNPDTIKAVAREGYHFVGLGPATALKQQYDLYRAEWSAHRNEPGRRNAHVAEPRLGALRQVCIAETDEQAMEIASTAYVDWNRSILKLWHDHDDHTWDRTFAWEGGIHGETLWIGSPKTVREKVAAHFEASGGNYAIAAFAWGTLRLEQSMRSLRLFAEKVMPAFAASTTRAAASA
jgi:alkanesulfonate monooxygenase SsuD/methylene tetrahydromethanopterin reductase-like flavin-dependent oxidoreductase (luciferase family)